MVKKQAVNRPAEKPSVVAVPPKRAPMVSTTDADQERAESEGMGTMHNPAMPHES